MNRLILIAVCVFVSTSALAAPQPNAVINRDKLERKLLRLNQQLTSSIGRAPNKQLADELKQIRDELDELRDYVARAPDYIEPVQQPVVVQQPPPPPPIFQPPPPPQPVTPQQLGTLINAINRESFGDGKVRVLQTAIVAQFFTVAQVKQVLKAFPFSKDKLTAASLLKPRILDPQNNYQLYDSFSFSNDKDKLRQILGDAPPRNGPRKSPPQGHRRR